MYSLAASSAGRRCAVLAALMVDEVLTKVYIDLPHHWGTGGESLWAEDLGGDLFRVRNVPFCAYGINFRDVVRATADGPGLKPEVREIVERSGHRTLRVFFDDSYPEDSRVGLLKQLNSHQAFFECATSRYFAIDIEPQGSYEKVCDQLWAWENAGFLSYETCEARVPGSFDDKLDKDVPSAGG